MSDEYSVYAGFNSSVSDIAINFSVWAHLFSTHPNIIATYMFNILDYNKQHLIYFRNNSKTISCQKIVYLRVSTLKSYIMISGNKYKKRGNLQCKDDIVEKDRNSIPMEITSPERPEALSTVALPHLQPQPLAGWPEPSPVKQGCVSVLVRLP